MSDEKRTPEKDTASVGLGHEAASHLGALKPPVYDSTTYVFSSAKEGKDFFARVYGDEGAIADGYIYSRLDSPSLKPAEARLAFWEGADDALIFSSGMGAISTLLLTFLRPGDLVLYSVPGYGGTVALMRRLLTEFGVLTRSFAAGTTETQLRELAGDDRMALIWVETPANPTNELFDIALCAEFAHGAGAKAVVDNTFLSPVWQVPIAHGADLVVHSATKYLGGHSDILAGAVCGGSEEIAALRRTRYEIGTTPSPQTGWLLARSLETLRIRVERQTTNATRIAAFLAGNDRVTAVSHLSMLEPGDSRLEIYERQCLGPGAMVAFEIDGGETESFRFLDSLQVIRLATSLGGTESLASHPWTMSPPSVPDDDKREMGITPGLIRLSVGIEHVDDLIADLDQALTAI